MSTTNTKPQSPLKQLLTLLLTVAFMMGAYYFSYIFLAPQIEEKFNNGDLNFLTDTPLKNTQKKIEFEDKGLRTPRVLGTFQELPKDIINEVVYKDVRLISTTERSFSQAEIRIIKHIIDLIPKKLFDYRPLAIISIQFDREKAITAINPEGVAFASGPYVFVSDATFKKKEGYDTGTMRGVTRVLAHEFMHVAQYFEMSTYPESFGTTYLEKSPTTQKWITDQRWNFDNKNWRLLYDIDVSTTEYGKSHPVEDLADSFGAMIIGDEYAISPTRSQWVLNWLGEIKNDLFKGTIPLSDNIKQRKVEKASNALLPKYTDSTAVQTDVMTFQSLTIVSPKQLSQFYNQEFIKRGWEGSINDRGIGEFRYKNIYKVNIEMDKNPLRVITIVMNTY